MPSSSSTALPDVLDALKEDLRVSERIVNQLSVEVDPTTRAELTMELIRLTSLVEDTMERAVYDTLEQRAPDLAAQAREQSRRVREAMVPVDHRVRHVAAMDVHRSDSEGFELELTTLADTLTEVRRWEVDTLYPVLKSMRGNDRNAVHDGVESARRHASEYPAPAGAIGRILHKVGAKMDHYPDVADKER
jgi:hypothetical protein